MPFLLRAIRGALPYVAIAVCSAVMLTGCFESDFISYDDSEHIATHAFRDARSAADYFVPKPGTGFIPLSYLSYKVDLFLHGRWTIPAFGSWAPGVRLDNWVLHSAAAMLLWRLLTVLGLSTAQAFFAALVFAIHPLACESVCWVSERKNILPALFGFGALWAQASLRGRLPLARGLVVSVLYALALMSKPSALGLLPILLLSEFAPKICNPAGMDAAPSPPSSRFALTSALSRGERAPNRAPWLLAVVLIALALADIRLNTMAQSGDLVAPPGGSIFTAALTDLEVFSRYIINVIAPIRLSAAYGIEAIRSPADSRVFLYGALLCAAVFGTIGLAENRRRCAFGWFWFFAALGPNCNFIAISNVMQDRYLYLATPGILIALLECVNGILQRLNMNARISGALRLAFAVFVVHGCLFLDYSRGFLWRDTLPLFKDAVAKEPRSFFAQYGLGGAYYTLYRNTEADDPRRRSELESAFAQAFANALTSVDGQRFNAFQDVALILGEKNFAHGNAVTARAYFEMGARKPAEISGKDETAGLCLAYLSAIDLFEHKIDDALSHGREALRIAPSDQSRLAFGRAAIEFVKVHPDQKKGLFAEARTALSSIQADSALSKDARAALETAR